LPSSYFSKKQTQAQGLRSLAFEPGGCFKPGVVGKTSARE